MRSAREATQCVQLPGIKREFSSIFIIQSLYFYFQFAEKSLEIDVNMTIRRQGGLPREGGCARVYAPRTLPARYDVITLNTDLPVCPRVVCAYICMSMCPSIHFKQLIEHKLRKT